MPLFAKVAGLRFQGFGFKVLGLGVRVSRFRVQEPLKFWVPVWGFVHCGSYAGFLKAFGTFGREKACMPIRLAFAKSFLSVVL